METFWKYTGIITWSLFGLWLLLRLFLGKTWLLKLGANILVRPGLLSAIKKLYPELPDKVQRDTLSIFLIPTLLNLLNPIQYPRHQLRNGRVDQYHFSIITARDLAVHDRDKHIDDLIATK